MRGSSLGVTRDVRGCSLGVTGPPQHLAADAVHVEDDGQAVHTSPHLQHDDSRKSLGATSADHMRMKRRRTMIMKKTKRRRRTKTRTRRDWRSGDDDY